MKLVFPKNVKKLMVEKIVDGRVTLLIEKVSDLNFKKNSKNYTKKFL